MKPNRLILKLNEVGLSDIKLVGSKFAYLGEVIKNLTHLDVKVPEGFVITTIGFKEFIKHNNLEEDILSIIKDPNQEKSKENRRVLIQRINNANFPANLELEIKESYKILSLLNRKQDFKVVIRPSIIRKDSGQVNFNEEIKSFYNIDNEDSLLLNVKKCISSFFNDGSLNLGQEFLDLGFSICIQKMIDTDNGISGLASSIDIKTGFDEVIVIQATYGAGEVIKNEGILLDQFVAYKPLLKKNYPAILERKIGDKIKKIVSSDSSSVGLESVTTSDDEVNSFCLNTSQIVDIAKKVMTIEDYFSSLNGEYCPMEVKWVLNGLTNEIYIVKANPETFHSKRDKHVVVSYKLSDKEKNNAVLKGFAIGDKIGAGEVKIVPANTKDFSEIEFKRGDILVTETTNPDWEPIMQLASAIITEKGSRTGHTAILSRDLGVPAVVGCLDATRILKNGDLVTVSCAEGDVGMVFKEILNIELTETDLKNLPTTITPVMVNIASPDRAFQLANMMNNGIGLARMEFIINNYIKIHPLALLNKIEDVDVNNQIKEATKGYNSGEEFFIEKLSYGLAKIAASSYPKQVIVRFSDFKSNEYANLLGGKYFEPEEVNPLIGWRGASRYYSSNYKDAFGLECKAIKHVRENLGLKNITVMIPFCRTVAELKKVYEVMEENGLKRKENELQVYLMAELPSNFILAEEFAEYVDGFSIGSNDLTQLVLGLDRDSSEVSHLYDERNAAVKKMILMLLDSVQNSNVKIGICGQGPSDFPDYAQFLVDAGIDSISVTPDSFVSTVNAISEMENKQKKRVFKMGYKHSFI